MTGEAITIALADDHPVVRSKGLKQAAGAELVQAIRSALDDDRIER